MELIATDMQRLEREPRIYLYEIDATKYGDGILRFTPMVDGTDTFQVWFAGVQYLRLPITAEGFEWSGTGTAPRPTLSLTAEDLSLLGMINRKQDLVGCPVKRIQTHRKYLDDGVAANPSAVYPVDSYVIERKASQKRRLLAFELSTPMDQQGKKLPARQVIRDTCLHRFRYWSGGKWNYNGVTCPYAGAAMYEPNGSPTADPTKAKCGKRIKDCTIHFGQDATLPMFAFPGVGRM